MKTGLIMIGGSLKGIYGHTGILSALDEDGLNIKPDVIMGASAGSVIASFYAVGLSRTQMYRKMIDLTPEEFVDLPSKLILFWDFIFKKGRNFTGFVKGDKLQDYVQRALGDKDDFSKTKIPLYVAATNLDNYELTLFNTGTISDKVRASTAIPMLFQPKKIGKSMYIDGAVRKEALPQALLDVEQDLDLIIVSNFSHEYVAVEENYLEESRLPLLEIVRRVFAMHESSDWPTQIGKTRIIVLKPGLRIPVDLFKPDPATAKEVYERAKDFALHKIKEELDGQREPEQ
jgi:predicted acylesterase/phospholipase RssA